MRVALAALPALAALVLVPSVASAGHGFMPPLRIDVGPAGSEIEPSPGLQVVAGLHWASLSPRPRANIDVGVGVISTMRGGADDPPMDAARGAPAREPLSFVGGYVEVATRTGGNHWWRTWIGSRLESGRAWRDDRHHGFVGVATRLSGEAYLTTRGNGGARGVAYGVLAIGLYGEVAARRFDGLGNDLGVSVGVSMRVPFIAN